MDLTQIIGIAAGVFTSASMLPQLIKLIKEKKAKDVSLLMLCVLLVGVSLWICYGFMKNDAPIIYTNIFSFTVNLLTLFMGIKYKDK